MNPRSVLLFIVLLAVSRLPSAAQAPIDSLSDNARVSLITILPGDEMYSLFGHSAFRVADPVQGIDKTYNYGTFSFSNPVRFVALFAYGRMDYMLSAAPYDLMVRHYQTVEHRPVIEQTLNLDRDQRYDLYRYLETNLLPENRTYRYDFLFDNCSTRLRAALEQTGGGRIRFAREPEPGKSFRRLLDPYVAARPFLDLGFDLLLGTPTDRRATPREADFLPLNLMTSFDHATNIIDGRPVPLVARQTTVATVEGYQLAKRTLPYPAILFALFLAVGAVITFQEWLAHTQPSARFDALLFGAAGVAGLFLLAMWFVTIHSVTKNNWNLAWLWPTHLVAAFLLVRQRAPGWLRVYWMAATAVTLLVLICWALVPQDFHTAIIPLLLLLALRSAWRAYRTGTATRSQKGPVRTHRTNVKAVR